VTPIIGPATEDVRDAARDLAACADEMFCEPPGGDIVAGWSTENHVLVIAAVGTKARQIAAFLEENDLAVPDRIRATLCDPPEAANSQPGSSA
jgi:hypothetical protein